MGVAGVAEAAVHAIRRLTDDLCDDNVLVKLDFVNTLNTVWRDTILDTVTDKAPAIYKFVLAAHFCESKLSREVSQQGDPLSAVEYCDAAQPTLLKSMSETNLGYMDDLKLKGKMHVVARDIEMIVADAVRAGFQLNPAKCKIVAANFNEVEKYPILKDFKGIRKKDLTILGFPILKGTAVDKALTDKISELARAIGRLTLLHAHDALCLLRIALAMPKLLCILSTAPRTENKLLQVFDDSLRKGLTSILSGDISDDQWIQASLPCAPGWFGSEKC